VTVATQRKGIVSEFATYARNRQENQMIRERSTDLNMVTGKGIKGGGDGRETLKNQSSLLTNYYLLQALSNQSYYISPSIFKLSMEMKLGPAHVRHEDKLATLFSSPTDA
jgi:hypothetical protein